MSLIFVESFDAIATADLAAKGWTLSNAPTVSSVAARTGPQSLRTSSSTQHITRGVPVAAEHATFIAGAAINIGTLAAAGIMAFLSDAAATVHVTITLTATGAIEARRGTNSGTILGASSAGVITEGVWHHVEAKVTLHDTTGAVTVRVNGAAVLTLTGIDTKNAGTKTVLDAVRVGVIGPAMGTSYFDDVYLCNGAGTVNNDLQGDCAVECDLPSGNGTSSQLLGSDANSVDNYALVDEAAPSTADYVGSGTLDQKDTYAYGDLAALTGSVAGVQISSLAAKTDAGARSIAHVTRSGATDYDSADMALATGAAYAQTVQETNPNTGAAWTRAAVNAAEFGIKVRP